MIDHLSSYATDYLKAKHFYEAVFQVLGYLLQSEFVAEWDAEFPTRRMCSFGVDGKSSFWVIETKQEYTPRHIAFSAPSRSVVDAFYTQATAQGGTDNGAPGLRPMYHEHYYAAFVIDPDGNNIEAVCHTKLAGSNDKCFWLVSDRGLIVICLCSDRESDKNLDRKLIMGRTVLW